MTAAQDQAAPGVRRAGGRERSGEAPLVTSPISQTFFELYPSSVKVKRPFFGQNPTPPDRSQTELEGFSKNSRSRLRFTAANSAHLIKTQFCMTYADVWPVNGRSLKADLNCFLVSVKKTFLRLKYIWIAEYQTRGCPHFHFFSSIEHTSENHRILTRKWHKIAGYGQEKHLNVHGHASNFILWSMGTGSYLCKYLDKEHQKSIPLGFQSFGRWWGNSRKLVSEPSTVQLDAISEKFDRLNVDQYGEIIYERDSVKQIIRTLGRHHEKYNRRSFFRKTNRSTLHLTGRPIFEQLTDSWSKRDEKLNQKGTTSHDKINARASYQSFIQSDDTSRT